MCDNFDTNQKSISLSILNVENVPEFLKKYKEAIKRINDIEKSNVKSNIKIQLANELKNIIHFDIMDNKFVLNTGVNIEYLKTVKNLGLYADTHLMVENPIGDKYVEKAIEYGTDELTIHYEIENFESILNYLNERKALLKKNENRDLLIGVSIKPNTNVDEIIKYKDKFSKLLIMTVEPGFGGQSYIDNINEKIKIAKKLLPNHIIQVDGGINFETIRQPLLLGVNSFVIGSYITKCDITKLYENLLKLNVLSIIEKLPKDSNVNFDTKLLQIVPGGYGEGDTLIGITVPNIRKIASSMYRLVNLDVLAEFINSKYHEYRKFAILCLSYIMKNINETSKDVYKMNDIILFMRKNIKYINNWDLTDEVGPNILGNYLINLDDKEAEKELDKFYISSDNVWEKRIGIVACLAYARKGYKELPLRICDKVIFDENPLVNKATGWVLREVYKKHPDVIKDYLKEKNSIGKIPRFVISYACEKMSKTEREDLNI